MADIETKIKALLARATDPGASEEERRTSAALAADLMKRHGFTPKAKEQEAAPVAGHRAPPTPTPAARPNPWEEMLERARRAEAAKTPQQRAHEKAERERQQRMSAAAVFGYELGRWLAKKL